MTIYKCECGKTKEIGSATMKYIEKKWRVMQAICDCGLWMDSEPEEGMPSLRSTEPTLSKKGDMLWDRAKERLCGERGVNEPFD